MLIFLCGSMGSGKSTVAPLLARALGLPVVSTDKAIEKKLGMTVPEIFNSLGEDEFRKEERKFIEKLSDNMVVDTGGGLPCFHKNMELMNEKGITIFLSASTQILVSRLENTLSSRPLLNTEDWKNKVDQLLNERLECYKKAAIHVNAEQKPPGILNEIIFAISAYSR